MTAEQSLRLYDEQATALRVIDGSVGRVTVVIERMEQALAGAVLVLLGYCFFRGQRGTLLV